MMIAAAKRKAPGLKPLVSCEISAGLKPCANPKSKNVASFQEFVKPRYEQGTFGIHSAALRTGSEAVPLSKTDLLSIVSCSAPSLVQHPLLLSILSAQHPLKPFVFVKSFVFAEFFARASESRTLHFSAACDAIMQRQQLWRARSRALQMKTFSAPS
jgi:hypothetical protein